MGRGLAATATLEMRVHLRLSDAGMTKLPAHVFE
jgi:hypothetical protein